jgi:hypothetical protein
MRRDYFTCVFLGLIAGALAFVFFSPLYFTYDGIVPRDFPVLERFLSLLYTLFFVFFLPFFAAFKKKEWINWGLAAYGFLIYLPLWFYPAEKLAMEDAGIATKLGALVLRTVYNVMQAPFAALSKLIGDAAASKIVYWLLPIAIFWPILLRVIRFYRLAYLSEQLNPMTPDQASPKAARKPEISGKPEVLGTVISAPVTAQTPADITRKHLPSFNGEDMSAIKASAEEEKPALKDGVKTKPRAGVRAPVRPVHIGAPGKKTVEALGAGTPAEDKKSEEPIVLGAPKPKADEAIPMPPPKPKADDVIQLGAPGGSGSDPAVPDFPSQDGGDY